MAPHDGCRILNDDLPEVRLVPDRIDSTVGARLVTELLHELADRYGGPDPDEPSPHDLAPPHGLFLVAWTGDEPHGCGGIRPYAADRAVAEIKRMYVRPTARRRGIARVLLAALESHASEAGYRRLILETGIKQPEAIAMYERAGYVPIESYGQYADYPESRCYGRTLDGTPRGSSRVTSG